MLPRFTPGIVAPLLAVLNRVREAVAASVRPGDRDGRFGRVAAA